MSWKLKHQICNFLEYIFFIFSFFLPAFLQPLSCPRRLALWLELCSKAGWTTDHLYSCCLIQHIEDLSSLGAEPAEVIANRGLMNFNYPTRTFKLGITQKGLVSTWIEKRDRKACMCSSKCQQLASSIPGIDDAGKKRAQWSLFSKTSQNFLFNYFLWSPFRKNVAGKFRVVEDPSYSSMKQDLTDAV